MSLTGPLRVAESEMVAYRRTWRGTVITSIVNPILFLAAMGAGLGSLVDAGSNDLELPYLAFVATGLMAASAMQNGATDGSFPVMVGILWRKNFHAAITTPISPADIILGRFVWAVLRLGFVLTVFAVIAVLFDAVDLKPALLSIPPSVLTGLGFLTVLTAWTVTREDSQGLTTMFRFGIIPLFLFSGTFFPIDQLPPFIQPIAYATPLFHGVELVRKISLSEATSVVSGIPMWVHVAYLIAMVAAGLYMSIRLLDRRLRT